MLSSHDNPALETIAASINPATHTRRPHHPTHHRVRIRPRIPRPSLHIQPPPPLQQHRRLPINPHPLQLLHPPFLQHARHHHQQPSHPIAPHKVRIRNR